jgi:hypothetical protein
MYRILERATDKTARPGPGRKAPTHVCPGVTLGHRGARHGAALRGYVAQHTTPYPFMALPAKVCQLAVQPTVS